MQLEQYLEDIQHNKLIIVIKKFEFQNFHLVQELDDLNYDNPSNINGMFKTLLNNQINYI